MHTQELPPEMIYEILSRTSLETLDTCKDVCKAWKMLSHEPSFMPLYCERTRTMFGYIIQTFLRNKFRSTFISINQTQEEEGDIIGRNRTHDDTKVLASSSRGICCCESRRGRIRRYYVCKPATQQWEALPNPKLRYKTYGVAVVVVGSSPLRYKIVRLSRLPIIGCMESYMCEVFDSKTWHWRQIQGLSLPYDDFIIDSSPAVSIGESIYWLTNDDNVITLDIFEERFDELFSLPKQVHKNDAYKCKQLVEYKGRLGLSCVKGYESMELWLKKGTNNSTWTRKMREKTGEESVYYPYHVGFYGATFYKIKDGSFPNVKLDYDFRYASEIFQFQSDMERVDLRGGR